MRRSLNVFLSRERGRYSTNRQGVVLVAGAGGLFESPRRFLAQVMTLGTWEEVRLVMREYGAGALREALENATAGVFDARSWAYWRRVFGLPEAELPRRSFE